MLKVAEKMALEGVLARLEGVQETVRDKVENRERRTGAPHYRLK